MESYVANMTAAVAALEAGAGAAARRHLASCPEDLFGWDWRHLSLRADPSLHVWKSADSLVFDVTHNADGTLLATASGPCRGFGGPIQEARILDAHTGETLYVLPSDTTGTATTFTADSRKLVSCSPNGSIYTWDIEAGELIVRHPARGLTLSGDPHSDGMLWAGANHEAAQLARRAGEARALVEALVEERLLMSRVIGALEADSHLATAQQSIAAAEALLPTRPWRARSWTMRARCSRTGSAERLGMCRTWR